MEVGSLQNYPIVRNIRQAQTARTRWIQYKGLEMGPGPKQAAAPQRQQDGHLQTFKSATSSEHTKQVAWYIQ